MSGTDWAGSYGVYLMRLTAGFRRYYIMINAQWMSRNTLFLAADHGHCLFSDSGQKYLHSRCFIRKIICVSRKSVGKSRMSSVLEAASGEYSTAGERR